MFHKRKISYCVRQRWQGVFRRIAHSHAPGPGRLDENAAQPWSAAMEATHVHGLDFRSPQAACSRLKVAHTADAAGHRRRKEKERPH